jgi:hypothetical protein
MTSFGMRHLLADVLLGQGRAPEAQLEAATVVRARPAFGPAWHTLGEAALMSGDFLTFEAVCKRLSGTGDQGTPTMACVLRAIELCAQKNFAAALGRLRGIEEHPAVASTLARVLFANGIVDERLEVALQLALAHDPTCPRAWAIRRALGPASAGSSGVRHQARYPGALRLTLQP